MGCRDTREGDNNNGREQREGRYREDGKEEGKGERQKDNRRKEGERISNITENTHTPGG